MGFQGRAGPPGPPGLGESGPPVSYKDPESVWAFSLCRYFDLSTLSEILDTLALFVGASRTTRCSRRERTPRRGISRT